MRIAFVVSPYRKTKAKSNFDSTLSEYWRVLYYEMFKSW